MDISLIISTIVSAIGLFAVAVLAFALVKMFYEQLIELRAEAQEELEAENFANNQKIDLAKGVKEILEEKGELEPENIEPQKEEPKIVEKPVEILEIYQNTEPEFEIYLGQNLPIKSEPENPIALEKPISRHQQDFFARLQALKQQEKTQSKQSESN